MQLNSFPSFSRRMSRPNLTTPLEDKDFSDKEKEGTEPFLIQPKHHSLMMPLVFLRAEFQLYINTIY